MENSRSGPTVAELSTYIRTRNERETFRNCCPMCRMDLPRCSATCTRSARPQSWDCVIQEMGEVNQGGLGSCQSDLGAENSRGAAGVVGSRV
jgi:hypothetical protein